MQAIIDFLTSAFGLPVLAVAVVAYVIWWLFDKSVGAIIGDWAKRRWALFWNRDSITTPPKPEPPLLTIPEPPPPASSPGICLNRLPATGAALFGRTAELADINRHWKCGTNVLTIVAEGGVGKTALVRGWLDQLGTRGYDGARVFGWSTYKQGSTEQASADEFIAEALAWFKHDGPLPTSPSLRGELLAKKVRERRTLLVIDGLEPLQHPLGPMEGYLKDQAVQALVKELAASNPGLCLITTRQPLTDINAPQIDLRTLTPEAGAQLLASLKVDGTAAERAKVAKAFGGHALALTLLGTYLRDACHGDLRRYAEVPLLHEGNHAGCHARRVMAAYESWLEPHHLAMLGLVSLFDRPAKPELVTVLRTADVLPGLPTPEAQWQFALSGLRRARLLADDPSHSGALDAHPLVRAYFADWFQRTDAAAWHAAHGRLYEYLRDTTPKFPDTLAGLEPLYQAVAHGCKAGRHQEALDEVYGPRIQRNNEHFSLHTLGAWGTELSVLAGFFDPPWGAPVTTLTPADQAWLLNAAGFTLRAVGRLDEAGAAMTAGLAAYEQREDWKKAAIAAGNLSQLHLLRGAVVAAVDTGRRAVKLADRSGDAFQKLSKRTILADALTQAGDPAAEAWFIEAERMQAEDTPAHPRLSSVQGYWYCDLLLDRGAVAEVRGRAAAALIVATQNRWRLDIALDTLTLGRAEALAVRQGAGDAIQAATLLTDAVAKLREAGTQDHLPLGLLARAAFFRDRNQPAEARRDLDEALTIARRGGMRLYLADIALEEARLALATRQRGPAREHLDRARTLIDETGYHRRDKDVAEIEEMLFSPGSAGASPALR